MPESKSGALPLGDAAMVWVKMGMKKTSGRFARFVVYGFCGRGFSPSVCTLACRQLPHQEEPRDGERYGVLSIGQNLRFLTAPRQEEQRGRCNVTSSSGGQETAVRLFGLFR